jgi:hypothetical protein
VKRVYIAAAKQGLLHQARRTSRIAGGLRVGPEPINTALRVTPSDDEVGGLWSAIHSERSEQFNSASGASNSTQRAERAIQHCAEGGTRTLIPEGTGT